MNPNLKTYRIMNPRLRMHYVIGDLIFFPILGLLALIFLPPVFTAPCSPALMTYIILVAAYLLYVTVFIRSFRETMNMALVVSDEGIGECKGRHLWWVDWGWVAKVQVYAKRKKQGTKSIEIQTFLVGTRFSRSIDISGSKVHVLSIRGRVWIPGGSDEIEQAVQDIESRRPDLVVHI